MSNLDTAKIEDQIKKTGFVLEHTLVSLLKKSNWHVINNKYYVDDYEENIREIDILAYKISKIQNISIYTTLLISCKKSESNDWALLSRDIDLKAPNNDWWPLHAWSNDKAINYKLNLKGGAKGYHEDLIERGLKHVLDLPKVEVFAFQEMDKKTGSPQNDKPIFGSITSLMKAQAYEVNSLPSRKKDAAIYQFNLLTVVDTELVRIHFEKNEKIKAHTTDSEHYIARYIIHKEDTFARIRFIKSNKFQSYLADYDKLHKENCDWFIKTNNNFYLDILKNSDKVSILHEDFRAKLLWLYRIFADKNNSDEFSDLSIEWLKDSNKPAIVSNSMTAEVIEKFETLSYVKKLTLEALKTVYRYEGDFIFNLPEDSIPF
jgi:hypothetical protein